MGNNDVSYNCPSCNSENIQKASVLVSSGSKRLSAITVGVGGGSSGINAGIGLSGGSIISELAAKLAPPVKPLPAKRIGQWKYLTFPSLLLLPSGLAFAFIMFPSEDSVAVGIVTIGLVILGIYLGYFRWFPSWEQKQARQEEEYTRALAQWEKTYFCLRCGSSFEIGRPS